MEPENAINIVVDEFEEEEEEEEEEESIGTPKDFHSDGEIVEENRRELQRYHRHNQHRPSSSLTLFTVGKTFQWISRAKIAAWFRMAFNIPDTSETLSNPASAPPTSPPTPEISPKRFLDLSPRRNRDLEDRKLTLEPHYRTMFGQTKQELNPGDQVNFTQNSVSRMMRSASGNFNDELIGRVYDTMMKESSSKMVRSQSSFEIVASSG